jgi:cobyrinic acid a,c-diamide synthase
MSNLARMIIAGTQSGVGKTTVALGLMGVLAHRGLGIQAFKVGPDFIDPSYHSLLTGRPSRNLDSWMLGKDRVKWIFRRAAAGADISIIEGVMGLYDGFAPTEDAGSTAQIAKLLKAPVILVVDAGMMARSVAAMVRGYQAFDRHVQIAGVIFNNVGGQGHYDILKAATERYCNVTVLGYLPSDARLKQPERHLGLIPAIERDNLNNFFHSLIEASAKTIDIDKVIDVARTGQRMSAAPEGLALSQIDHVKIAVARDEAFNFYYQDNLEILQACGAELHFFSPLQAEALSDDVDGLIFGGGFPELYAGHLEKNKRLRVDIYGRIARGLPTYAECGGLMYLSKQIIDQENRAFQMVGAINSTTRMTSQLVNFGYAEVKALSNNLIARVGETARGHEFHYSDIEFHEENSSPAYQVTHRKGPSRDEGVAQGSLLASYVHLHFANQPLWAERFVQECAEYRRSRQAEGPTIQESAK